MRTRDAVTAVAHLFVSNSALFLDDSASLIGGPDIVPHTYQDPETVIRLINRQGENHIVYLLSFDYLIHIIDSINPDASPFIAIQVSNSDEQSSGGFHAMYFLDLVSNRPAYPCIVMNIEGFHLVSTQYGPSVNAYAALGYLTTALTKLVRYKEIVPPDWCVPLHHPKEGDYVAMLNRK